VKKDKPCELTLQIDPADVARRFSISLEDANRVLRAAMQEPTKNILYRYFMDYIEKYHVGQMDSKTFYITIEAEELERLCNIELNEARRLLYLLANSSDILECMTNAIIQYVTENYKEILKKDSGG